MPADCFLPPLTLVLGGARSGKSALAERLVLDQAKTPHYVATAEAGDLEMQQRIARHQARRGDSWITHEVPLALGDTLADVFGAADRSEGDEGPIVLVDCLTLWLSNLMFAERDVNEEIASLSQRMANLPGPIVAVSNEVGLGIVPDNALARRFRDLAGQLNQTVAAGAQSVIFVAAGLPMTLKGPVLIGTS
ncbi:MAG: bifunctional adenosylcobinamide kinase/adenosylcobinamide-phosphate guanylyltransferase [Pseudomonadota bacterium]